MPWHVARSDECPASKPWAVITDSSGDVVGCHESQAAAQRQMAALYANEPEASGRSQMSEHKSLTGVSVKDADEGVVEAVFSTFGVVDKDGDITDPGAFEDGASVRISAYGHTSWGGQLPVGRGVIKTTDDEAILLGQFFLNTTGGRDTFEAVKGLGELQEWSYGFDVIESEDVDDDEKAASRRLKKLKVHEVSPVLLGAGIDTRTLTVKHTGWFDRVDDSIPMTFTSATATTGKSLPLCDEVERALGSTQAAAARIQALGSLRAEGKEGRVLSAANRERLTNLLASWDEAATHIRELLAETDPEKDKEALYRELALYERGIANL